MMFEHKDILIVGDSFCGDRDTHNDWPMIISQRLTGYNNIPRGYGFGGGSWWSTRKRLLSELEICVPKVLIMCHTEPNRIPNDMDCGINSGILGHGKIALHGEHLDMDRSTQQKIVKAAVSYYEQLWCGEYCRWAQQAWHLELDALIASYNIPYVVHLLCFDSTVNYVFQNGMTIKERLWAWAGYPEDQSNRNHFTDDQNQKFGNRLADLILINPTGLVELSLP
jgi:hypothetical protein